MPLEEAGAIHSDFLAPFQWSGGVVNPLDLFGLHDASRTKLQSANGCASGRKVRFAAPFKVINVSVDGSFCDCKAKEEAERKGLPLDLVVDQAWAIVITGALCSNEPDDDEFIAGYGGLVPQALGCQPQNSSLYPECAGVIAGLAWIMQDATSRDSEDRPGYRLRFDNMAAGYMACLRSTLRSDDTLRDQVTGFAHFADARIERDVSFVHCKGHSGDAWNELADIIAKSVTKGAVAPTLCCREGLLDRFLNSRQSHHWLWFLEAKRHDVAGIWPNVDAWCIADKSPCNDIRAGVWDRIQRGLARDASGNASRVKIHLRVASANVLTLLPKEEKRDAKIYGSLLLPGRMELLSSAFEQLKLLLIGIQEGRAPWDEMRSTRTHILVRAASTSGSRGVQLWIARTIAYGHYGKNPLYVQPSDVTVLLSHHSLLLCRIESEWLQLDVAVIHAPVEPRNSDEEAALRAVEFWEWVRESIARRGGPLYPLILLCDANGAIGSVLSTGISDFFRTKRTSTELSGGGHLTFCTWPPRPLSATITSASPGLGYRIPLGEKGSITQRYPMTGLEGT